MTNKTISLFVLVNFIFFCNASYALDAVFNDEGEYHRICINISPLNINCKNLNDAPSSGGKLLLGNINEDKYLDLVIANSGTFNYLCLGKGLRDFDCNILGPKYPISTKGLELSDVDGDSSVDIVFGNHGGNVICYIKSDSNITCDTLDAGEYDTHEVVVGDFDEDGLMDLVFANRAEKNQICINLGDRLFKCDFINNDEDFDISADVGLINDDDHLDILFIDSGRNSLCIGDGTGKFSCKDFFTDLKIDSQDVALADVDKDGNIDAVLADSLIQVCLGDGVGNFTCTPTQTDEGFFVSVSLGFINEDEYIDAIFPDFSGLSSQICLNNRKGNFNCKTFDSGTDRSDHVALGSIITEKLIHFDDFE